MTQGELADALGVRFQQVQKYESGANRISASRLWVMAQALKVPITYFYDGLASIEPLEDQPETVAADISVASMMIQFYANMTEGERQNLRALADKDPAYQVMLPTQD